MHDNITMLLGITAALLHGVAYLLYAIQTKVGRSSPKSATWGVWVFITIINALTFNVMSANWVVALQFFAGSLGCSGLFLYMLATKKLKWPTSGEWGIVGIGVIATMVWMIFRNATYANLIILLALAIPFKPMYEELWRNPTKETPRSWILWTLAFLVTTINVVVNWSGHPLNLVMPIGGALLHGAVAILASEKRRIAYEKAHDPWWGWFLKKCPRCGNEEKCHSKVQSTAWDKYHCEECGYSDTVYVGFGTI